jgi:hypothetical protein
MVEKVVDTEEILLQKCKSLIQSKLGWEQSDSWTNQDFHMLAEKIQESTGVNLSVATLKRIWGKVRYDSRPTVTTLNTLAQYLGFEHWRAFKQSCHDLAGNGQNKQAVENGQESSTYTTQLPKRKWRSGIVVAVLGACILVMAVLAFRRETVLDISSGQYSFSSKKVVTEGIPNSVIFDYDASKAPTDSVFIQQSWDERLRSQVPKEGRQHTSIYYTPGFFEAKLVIGKQIVKEHDLWIKSNGWLALVRQNPVPVYFDSADFRKPGMLSVPIDKVKATNIPFQPDLPWVSYYNVKDFGDIRTDNYVFETEVRSDYKEGNGACQFSQILLLLEGSVISIPLTIKGCVSDIGLGYDGTGISGKEADLSAFGCDMTKWVKVRCEAINNRAQIFINDSIAYDTKVEEKSKRIVGILYRFQGTGSIKSVKLSRANGEYLYEEMF